MCYAVSFIIFIAWYISTMLKVEHASQLGSWFFIFSPLYLVVLPLWIASFSYTIYSIAKCIIRNQRIPNRGEKSIYLHISKIIQELTLAGI